MKESVKRDIEFERKQERKIKQLCSVPKRRLLTQRVKETSGNQSIPKTAIFQVLSSVGSVSSGFLCQRARKINTPSSLFPSSMNLDVKALVDKDAEGLRGIVWLRLIRPKQTVGLWPMKILESVS